MQADSATHSAPASPQPLTGVPRPSSQAESLRAFLRSFVFAGGGLWHTLRTQRNMRVHAALAIVAVALGVVVHLAPVEWALVCVAITGVVITEMFNTVIEAIVDLVSPQPHPLAKVAKDVAAGAVLLNAILAVAIALFVYLPHLWPLLLHLLHS
jgi:diacylglycerol kinase